MAENDKDKGRNLSEEDRKKNSERSGERGERSSQENRDDQGQFEGR
jgi:hypothetical protein